MVETHITDTYNLFVYGSLKKGFHNHHFLKNSTYCGEFVTKEKFIMNDHISFPSIIPATKGWSVLGELYIIDNNTLNDINRLEGYPHFYDRMITNVYNIDENDLIKALVYIAKGVSGGTTILPEQHNLLIWSKK